jgi:hypothetical protein
MRQNLNKTCYHETVQDENHSEFMDILEKQIDTCNKLIEQKEKQKELKKEKKLKLKQKKQQESMKQESMKQESMEQESMKQESMKQESMKQESMKQESEDLAYIISSLIIGGGSVKKKKTKPKKEEVSEASLFEEMKIKSGEERTAMYKNRLNIIQDRITALTYIHKLGNTKIGKNVLKNYYDLIVDINLYFNDPKNEKLITQIDEKYKNLAKVEKPLREIINKKDTVSAFQEKLKVYKTILLMLLYIVNSLNFVIFSFDNHKINLETYEKIFTYFQVLYTLVKNRLEKADTIAYNDIESYKALFKNIDHDLGVIQFYFYSSSNDPFINQLNDHVSELINKNMLKSEEFNDDIYDYYINIKKYIEEMIIFGDKLLAADKNDMSSYKSK